MNFLAQVRNHALALPPMAKLAIGMAVIVGISLLFQRVKLPGMVGLLLGGILFGPHGIDVFGTAREYAYDRDTHIGKLDRGLVLAPAAGWTLVSMKNDWLRIFPGA